MRPIKKLNLNNSPYIQSVIDNKTKPLGALGMLEPLALQLALITSNREQIKSNNDMGNVSSIDKLKPSTTQVSINNPSMMVFAGDHGINEENLSIAPSDVTKQMVLNFLHGGAAINCFCQSNDIALTVVDCGILSAVSHEEMPKQESRKASRQNLESTDSLRSNQQGNVQLIDQRLGAGTHNFSKNSAMSIAQVEQGFAFAEDLIDRQVQQGVELVLLGEMGIANTSSAAALMSALTGLAVKDCVGRGTGISDEQLIKKIALIKQAIKRLSLPVSTSKTFSKEELIALLAQLGGFEIVQMVSAILTAASASIPVVIDGFIVSVAALVALRLDNKVANYLIFSHLSQEKAHQALLKELLAAQDFSQLDKEGHIEETQAKALLDLGLRLGEGTGAALALPLIKASANFYNNMASFESAGVTV